MKPIFALSLLVALAACANEPANQFDTSRPEPRDQERMERNSSDTYKKSVSAAATDSPVSKYCYNTTKGCDARTMGKQSAVTNDSAHPPSSFPKLGYALGNDGLYHFSDSAMNRD